MSTSPPPYLATCRCRWEVREAQRQARQLAETVERLQPWAFIYMVTKGSGAEVPMYLATRTDAETFCSDDRTKGIGRGGPWLFMFTAAATYLYNPMGHTSIADLAGKARADDGRFAGLAVELGLTLYGRDDWHAVLDPILQGDSGETAETLLDDDQLDLFGGAA